MKILFVGDSITAERASAGITVYSQMLAVSLPSSHPEITWGTYTTGYGVSGASFINHGHPGWATQDYHGVVEGYGFKEVFQTEALNENADIVAIMLGTNDEYSDNQTSVRVSLADYKTNLISFVDQLRALNPNVKIILISPPPVVDIAGSPLKKGDNVRTATYAQAVSEVATLKVTRFIDLYNLLWNASSQSQSTFNTTYTLDGMHLNQTGQNYLRDLVSSQIVEIITAPIEQTPSYLFKTELNGEFVDIPLYTLGETWNECFCIFLGGQWRYADLVDRTDQNATNDLIYINGAWKAIKA